ncbi:S6 family peptidase [Achromobacter dolens]|uniref:S6 family peptidase n=1 Tax=Achromobacter dolens TaxID=1287738 RepID=UPI0031DC9E05
MGWKSLSPGRNALPSLPASPARPDPRDKPGRHGAPRLTLRPICHGLSILAGLLAAAPLQAAMVGTDLPYQTYRDFAENKGEFRPGAQGIPLHDKAGAPYAILDRAPMIDFSVADTSGIATLVAPQYVVSVKHNGGYAGVAFGYRGDTRYTLVNRNNHRWEDFHSPRLNKVVTEVSPIAMTDAGDAAGTYTDLSRFPVFYRVGSGVQRVQDRSGVRTRIAGGYAYLTGGTVGSPEDSYWFLRALPGATYSPKQGPMASYGGPGDSGSPLFAWDAQRGRWTLVAVQTGWSGEAATLSAFNVIPVPDVMDVIDGKTDAPVVTQRPDDEIHWTYDRASGTGALSQAENAWTMHGRFGANQAAALDHGKDLAFRGGGIVTLESTVDQGAGALTFDGRYAVRPTDTQTWRGGGITVNAEAFVDWQVNGVAADSLHKLGAGTLKISASGINPGTLNIGDGTVILAQRADASDRVQAFAAVRIVSGRPTLVLADSRQIDPDNIQWGFRGGKLDINGNDLTFHRLNGADAGAVLTNSGSPATVNLAFDPPGGANATTLWHGHFTGNLDIANTATPQGRFAIDGGIDSTGAFIQQNGLLYLQGHPLVHAANTAAVADKLKSMGDDSLRTRPVSFAQPDWETRHFRMASLQLRNARLHLGRNAVLATDILADNSIVTLGSASVFIDLNDGTAINTAPAAGESRAGTDAGTSRFEGGVTLANHSTLHIAERFNGGIDSADSETHVSSPHAVLDRHSVFTRSLLNLREDARVTSHAGLASDGEVRVGARAILSMRAAAVPALPATTYSAESWRLNGPDASLEAGAGTRLAGNIVSDDAAHIRLGGGESVGPTAPRAAYLGDIAAPASDVTMQDLSWQVRSTSSAKSLRLDRADLALAGASDFRSLDVDVLTMDDSQVFMRTDGLSADRITVRQSLAGRNNALHVLLARSLASLTPSPTPLVTAPPGTRGDVFTLDAPTRELGFHRLTPQVAVVATDTATQWVLQGFALKRDEAALQGGTGLTDVGRQNFLTEVNNLNRRMGDLRHAQGNAGGWARLMNGSGSSARGGSTSRYTHLQLGADRKFAFAGADVYAGATMTFTDNRHNGRAFSGKTRSSGGGLYASALFDAGWYVDVIGKYVLNRNHYGMPAMGLAAQDYGGHSWYLGAEAGRRITLVDRAFVEPQVELVYGTVPGHRFDWQYHGANVSVRQGRFTPLIGRVGLAAGKSFEGTAWQLTSLAALSYQFDLRAPGATSLRDDLGQIHASHGKDGRMLMELGVNARIRGGTRLSLSMERSAFGRYNTDKAINANIRHAF